jgi:hypothetical protein
VRECDRLHPGMEWNSNIQPRLGSKGEPGWGSITMTRRSAARRRATRSLDREAAFVAAINEYQHGGNPDALLQAADAVTGSKRPIAPEHADTISVLTDNLNVAIETYGEAGRAVGLWFATTSPARGWPLPWFAGR